MPGTGSGCCDVLFRLTALANLAAGYNLAIAGHVLFLIEDESASSASSASSDPSEAETSWVAGAAFAGAITGQVIMGYVGERIGVVRGLRVALGVLIFGCLAGAGLCWAPNMLEKLAVSRFFVGFGAGGAFPLVAIAAADSSPSAHVGDAHASGRGGGRPFNARRVMMSFSFQVVGQLVAPLLVLILDAIFPEKSYFAWRVAVLCGAIPAGFAVGLSQRLLGDHQQHVAHHSEEDGHRIRRGADVDANADADADANANADANGMPNVNRNATNAGGVCVEAEAEADEADEADEAELFDGEGGDGTTSFGARWTARNMRLLAGTGLSWFLFDVIFYGNIIFLPFVVEIITPGADSEATISALSTGVSFVALCGIALASLTTERIGRKRLQMVGFVSLGAIFFSLALTLAQSGERHPGVIFTLYAASFFFFNFGPNASTFCLPAETFDKDVRSFFGGLSAALGKLGALAGAALFKLLLDSTSLAFVMLVSAIVAALAVLLTTVFVRDDAVRAGLREDHLEPLNETGSDSVDGDQQVELVRIDQELQDSLELDRDRDDDGNAGMPMDDEPLVNV